MKTIGRYKELTSEVSRVINAFLSYKNGDTGFYKDCVSRWSLSDLDRLKMALLTFDVEGVRHELYGLDGEPLKRFCRDIEQRCTPLYDEEIFGTSNKELYSLLTETHGKGSVAMMHNLKEIAHINNIIVGDVCSIIDELQPQEQPQEPCTERELPSELDTEQARKYFERAVVTGLMTKQYKWLESQAQLGYFCLKAFEQPRPLNTLEAFFNVKKLSSSITQATYEAKRADVKKWRTEQDKKIFFD